MTAPWLAAEWFVSGDVQRRNEGRARLTSTASLRFSPLVLYLLASRIDEPELALRGQIIAGLAHCFELDADGFVAPNSSRDYLAALVRNWSRRQVECVLESPGGPALILLDRIPHAPALLAKIAADRLVSFPVRHAALNAIGDLGAASALPALEGLKTRIEGQQAGQLAMNFAPPSSPEDERLLEALKQTIAVLREDA